MKLPEKNWLEWLVFGISTLLVAGVLGYLAYSALTTTDVPPQLEVTLGDAQEQPNGYVVPVRVTNTSDQTAESVMVEVALSRGDAEVETGEFTIAFVPRQSSAEGWVVFSENPAGGELQGRVLGYEEP